MDNTESIKEFHFEKGQTSITINIPEVLEAGYGFYVWPGAPVLAEYVWRHADRVRHRRVLELGAGTALPGLVAAQVGAQVTLSDAAHLPACRRRVERSLAANGLSVTNIPVIRLTWGKISPDLLRLPPPDIILGSDCFYDTKDFEAVLMTVRYLLDHNPEAEFWTSYQERSSDRSLEALLHKWRLQGRAILADEAPADTEKQNISATTHSIHLLIITHLSPNQDRPLTDS